MAATIDDVVSALNNVLTQMSNLISTIKTVFPTATGGTATSATGGAATALPAQPAGYIISSLPNGTTIKTPYYNP